MSLLNGMAGLGAGLTSFADAGVKDEEARTTRQPLMSSAAPAPDTAPAEAPAAASAAQKSTTPAYVPAALLPIYAAAAKRTGIPVEVLIAQGKQESNFNPDAVGSAGEIGLHQIKPSTAADPGYGMKGIDPAMLKDVKTNINFAADYLKARAGNGVDFSNPAAVDAALAKYNGGGDPRYVENVRRHMGVA